ncbi:PREDICTED: protein LYRIC isoform X5 [Gekko japonicus]|uniref:Protein LYRIC isoform X5 n=1 Tax=Gekko japonicus TaxID=146911 RepID=A0ABM1JV67_GEKJA|nr:PREDICTED: protein LYRIC isoform X5 [Gekko japonicus]
MAAPSWQEAVAQQAEEVSSRLRDVLSAGVGLLRTELGLQLPSGLEPQRLPTWLVLLSTSLLALLVLLGLLWAATCARAGDARKKRPGRAAEVEEEEDEEEDDDEEEETAVVGLTGGGGSGGPNKAAPGAATMLLLKGEEQKKRNKKKPPEKMGRLNGQPVHEVSEEEIMQTVRRDNLKQPSDAEKKTEKSKKNKKKPKGDTKTVQDQSRTEGKEIDEGAWETKISNREKRQQRKRDKVLTDAGSESNLPGMENSVTVSTEQLTSTTSFSVGPRKSKGDSTSNIQVSNSKSGKGDAVLQQGLNEGPTVNGGNWNEKPVKLSSQIGTSEEKWTSVSSAAAWSGVDGRINTPEQSSASFTSLGLNPAVSGSSSESVSQPGATDFQWDLNRNQAHIDDEWSGLNGLSPADPSSDWNAPAEEWGNWVEEEKAPSTPQLEEALSEVQKISDDDREKTEPTLNSTASGKSKKKKKKKKKQGEEASSPVQDAEDLDRDAGEECSEDTSKVQQEEISFSLKTISTSEEAEPEEMPSFAVSTEPSVTVSENESDKIPSQVPQMLQETEVPISNVKQNSVPPPQTKSEESWESPKQIKKKKKARRET